MEEDSKLGTRNPKKEVKVINKIKNKFFNKSYKKIENKVLISNEIISKSNNKNYTIKMTKTRNPGVDTARLIAMYSVVFFHYLFFGRAYEVFPHYKRKLSFVNAFTNWHNNCFIIISGIVGYKTNKYSNLIYLWLSVCFYTVGINKYANYFIKGIISREPIYKLYYPIIFNRYWFVTSYFGMYLFLPVINKGISGLTKYEFRLVIITTFFLFIFWNEYKNPNEDIFHAHHGSSITFFLTLYLTGAYFGKYNVDYKGIKKYIYCIFCLGSFSLVSYIFFKTFNNDYYYRIGKYVIKLPPSFTRMINNKSYSLVKPLQALLICLFFMQINYNEYIAKIITFFGPLAFGIYLIHMDGGVKNFIYDNDRVLYHYPRNISFNSLISSLALKSLKVCLLCLIIDYLRHLLFSILQLKKIFIFIETKIKEKLS